MQATLAEIVANKKVELKARKTEVSLAALQANITLADGSFDAALSGPSLKLICELKPKSPSAGVLQASPDVAKILESYNQYASAISVLTDEKYFGGSLELLRDVSAHSPRPTLCKDFIVDSFQCFEARRAGAQAVLLIVKILDDETLAELHQTITELKMTPVVEVQSESELERALKLAPQVILINNRNLDSFEISFQTTINLAPQIADSIIKISASGVSEKAHIEQLIPYCSNFLVGSSLMAAPDMKMKLEELSSVQPVRTANSAC